MQIHTTSLNWSLSQLYRFWTLETAFIPINILSRFIHMQFLIFLYHLKTYTLVLYFYLDFKSLYFIYFRSVLKFLISFRFFIFQFQNSSFAHQIQQFLYRLEDLLPLLLSNLKPLYPVKTLKSPNVYLYVLPSLKISANRSNTWLSYIRNESLQVFRRCYILQNRSSLLH